MDVQANHRKPTSRLLVTPSTDLPVVTKVDDTRVAFPGRLPPPHLALVKPVSGSSLIRPSTPSSSSSSSASSPSTVNCVAAKDGGILLFLFFCVSTEELRRGPGEVFIMFIIMDDWYYLVVWSMDLL